MRVIFLRANAIDPDPRVEKEAKSLLRGGHSCIFVGWDRTADHEPEVTHRTVGGHQVPTILIGVKASFGQGAKNAPNVARYQLRLFKWLKENVEDYDAIHACDLDTGIAACQASRKTGKPLVYDVFDFYSDSRIMPDWMRAIVRKIEYSVIGQSCATIICTEQRAVQVEGSRYRQLVVIENTPEEIELDEACESGRADTTKITLAYVGILTADRYLDRLLDAVDQHENLVLNIGGFGPLSEMIERRANANQRIRYRGRLAYHDALVCEKKADVMFGMYDPSIANHRLAAPNKYYESLMLGTPLITVRGTSVADWVEEEKTGEALDPDFDSTELYEAVLRLVEANRDGELSRLERVLYKERHSWSVMEKRLLELYDSISLEMSSHATDA